MRAAGFVRSGKAEVDVKEGLPLGGKGWGFLSGGCLVPCRFSPARKESITDRPPHDPTAALLCEFHRCVDTDEIHSFLFKSVPRGGECHVSRVPAFESNCLVDSRQKYLFPIEVQRGRARALVAQTAAPAHAEALDAARRHLPCTPPAAWRVHEVVLPLLHRRALPCAGCNGYVRECNG